MENQGNKCLRLLNSNTYQSGTARTIWHYYDCSNSSLFKFIIRQKYSLNNKWGYNDEKYYNLIYMY